MCEMNDIPSMLMDEIALEGLDGITIEGLFVRLRGRPEFATCLNDRFKQYIWDTILRMSDIDILELPEPRKPLVIFNRYDYVDPELGMVLEPENVPEEIYPHAPVDDKVNGIRGSCFFYKERISVYKIASQMTLKQAEERWGTKLVFVASQRMRNIALMGTSIDPELELAIIQYCILERIGRSRHLGEVTQGRVSLQITGEDPKALFYHRKFLMKNGLIVKQVHHQKSGNQNCSGSLLHLPRFFVERWPKVLYLTKQVIEILRGCKNYLADYDEIRKKLSLTNSLKKLFQTTYFQRFVRTDLRLPYRHLYPDAKESEWRSMNSLKEKMIRVIQLLDPNADVEIVSTREDEFDVDDDEHGDGISSEFSVTLNRSFLAQAYKCVESAGVNGYSQMEMVQKMGIPKLSARTVSRNLLRKGLASTFMNDIGRQRVSKFRARKWDQQCTRIQTIERDIQHMRAELLSKALGAGHEIPTNTVTPNKSNNHDKNKKRKHFPDKSLSDSNIDEENSQDLDDLESSPPNKILKLETPDPNSVVSDIGNGNLESAGSVLSVPSSVAAPVRCSSDSFNYKEAVRKYFQHQSKDGPVMTYRIFKRINMILEYVKIHKVVDDYSKFLKLINEEEDREGLKVKIDKKSLLRLLIRLKEGGRLKLHSYLLTDGTKVKTMMFICDNNVPIDHPAVVSAIEQAKMKLFIVNRDSINLSVACSDPIQQPSIQNQKYPNKKQKMTFVYDKTIGKRYGFSPKFVRMRTLHLFLFYVVYGYDGVEGLDQNLVVPFLESKDITVDEGLQSELTQVYKLELSWKMFIPRLPPYSGWPEGWSIVCDLLLRLPLSLFVSIFNVCYIVPGLNEYLQHPVRRHFLVRQLPVSMRNGLMAFRKYIFSIHEVMQRLCFIGLLQFGPQRLKEKDQVLIYLNRKTSLLDTVTSKPGYHQISEEIYPETKYEFKCMLDVETYWYNLWNICLNTQLGGRMCVHGKDIVLEQLATKPQMQAVLQPVRPSRAPTLDVGEVPGDRRGAAGLDSAIFAHLKRNWNWANVASKGENVCVKKIDRRRIRLMNLKAAPVVFTKSAIIIKRSINYLHNGRFSAVRPERRPHTLPPGAEVLPKRGNKKRNVVRRVEARKKSRSSNKPYYDEVDLKALQLMSKLRVDWSIQEDTLLLLCKVASMYLCPNPRQQTIAFSEIRDILHFYVPEAQNKTSRACQRRILYMLKNLATSNNLAMNLEELKQDEDIFERFGRPQDNVKGSKETTEEYEVRINEKFRKLVNELHNRSDRMLTASETFCRTIPDKEDEFWKLFDVVEPTTVIKSKGVFQDVKNIVDIHCSVVNTIIHSSLCSSTDKTSWAYQLFRVYQQYPDSLLRAAMAKLRQDQMVSLKKSFTRHKQKGNYLPLSSSPYQLSISYLQLIQTKYQYGVFNEAYKMIKEIIHWLKVKKRDDRLPLSNVTGGAAAVMVETLCKKDTFLTVEIPDQVIILDPWISEKDETYTRIVERYKDILQTYRTGRDSTTSALFRSNTSDSKVVNKSAISLNKDHDHSGLDNFVEECSRNKKKSETERVVGNDGKNVSPIRYNPSAVNVAEDLQSRTIQRIGQNDTESTSLDVEMHSIASKEDCENIESNDSEQAQVSNLKRETVGENISQALPLGGSNKIEVSHSPMDLDEISHSCEEHDLIIDERKLDSTSSQPQESEVLTQHTGVLTLVEDSNSIEYDKKNLADENSAPKPMQCSVSSESSSKIVGGNEVFIISDNHEKCNIINKVDTLQSNSTDDKSECRGQEHLELKSKLFNDSSTLSKVVQRRWGRLDFEWISEKEWDSNADASEHTVEESDVTDGSEEDRIREEYVDIDGESEDIESISSGNQQTMVARAATRIALFMMREEIDDPNQLSSHQHAHDFFVVNSCSVFCTIPDEKKYLEDHSSPGKSILPLTESTINQVLDTIKSEAVADLEVPQEEEVLKCAPADYWSSMKRLLNFVEAKKYLGVTLPQIQAFYETLEDKKLDLATVLSLFVQQRIAMRTGVSVIRYVHQKHIWPWLAHTFKFVRLEREKVVPIESQIMLCTDHGDESNVMEVDEICPQPSEKEKISINPEEGELLIVEDSDESCSVKLQEHVLHLPETDSQSTSNCERTVPCKKKQKTGKNVSVALEEKRFVNNDVSDEEAESLTPASLEENCVKECVGRRASGCKTMQVTVPQNFGTIVASKDIRKAAQSLTFSEKEELHVVIRPWIRINGTLNRRVLDRLLGSVLGHAMYQPGQSLYAFGRRFQPALQPVHTRELVEILQCLGCVKLLVQKQKQKVTLFSKPQSVVLVDADGTEDEQEIFVEPKADAVFRLAQFIGEKSYAQDFMAMQEQMFSGRGSSEEVSKEKFSESDSDSDNADKSEQE